MNHPDFKKFTGIFLIVAALTSSLALIFSNSLSHSSPSNSAHEEVPSIPRDAFSDNTKSDNQTIAGLSSDVAGTADSHNLTAQLSNMIAKGVVDANPDGPQYLNGKLSVKTPEIAKVGNQYALSVTQSITPPQIDERNIKTLKTFAQDDLLSYLQSLQKITQDTYGGTGVLDLLQKNPGPELAGAVNLFLAQSEAQLYALSVPAPLTSLHRSLLRTLETQKQMFDIQGSDPLKTALLVQDTKRILGMQKKDIESQLEILKKNAPNIVASIIPNNHQKTLFAQALFINEAHAIIVEDIVNLVENAISAVESVIIDALDAITSYVADAGWLLQLITEYLKDVLLQALVDAIINWVNGGGKPQYVPNWKKFLGDAFNNAAGAAIQQIAPNLCSNFGPLIKVSLLPTNTRSSTRKYLNTSCTLTTVVNNIQNFYKSFQNGGWIAYGATLQPNNNFFGSLIQTSDIALREGSTKQDSAKAEVTSGNGYQSQKTCVTTQPSFGGLKTDWESDPNFVSASSCDADGSCTITLCDPDGWQVTTPGNFIADTINNAAGSSPAVQRIVNAQDITDVENAIINYAINKLMQSANGLFGVQEVQNVQSQTDLCRNLYPDTNSQQYKDCIANAQTVTNTTGGTNASKDNVIHEAQQILQSDDDALPYAQQAADLADKIVTTLQAIIASTNTAPACVNAQQQAKDQLVNAQQSQSNLHKEVNDLQKAIADMPGFISQVQNDTSTNPGHYTQLLSQLHTQFGTSVQAARRSGEDQSKISLLKKKVDSVNDLLSQCSTSTP